MLIYSVYSICWPQPAQLKLCANHFATIIVHSIHQHYMASSAVQSTITIYKVHNANHLCLSEHLSIGDSPLVIGNISGVSGPVFRHIHIQSYISSKTNLIGLLHS